MHRLIRLLHVEDVEDDSILLVNELERHGLQVSWTRVDNADDLENTLRSEHWDIVVSDFSLPGFDAHGSLEIVRSVDPDIPFVVLSGTIGEETTADLIRRGAQYVLTKDRSERWISVIRREVSGGWNRVERAAADHALREMQTHYHATFDMGPLAIFHAAPDGEILRANRRFTELLGREPGVGPAVNLHDITHPDDREQTRLAVAGLLSGETDPLVCNKRYLDKDGAPVWVEVHSTAIRDQLQRPKYVLSFVKDITSTRRTEQALRESDARYRTLVELAKDIILTIDEKGRFTMVNEAAERASGWTRSELVGTPFAEFVHPDDVVAAESALHHVLQTGEFATVELRTRTADGGWLQLEATASPEFRGGRIAGVGVIARDLSARRRAEEERARLEEQLETADRLAALGRVSAGIAHEFNNVLMGISPFAEVIQKRNDLPDIADASRHIVASIARGRRITNEVLRFTRPVPPDLSDIPVESFMTGLESRLRVILNGNVRLEVDIESEQLCVRADREQLEQVIFNLVANARDAMPGGGVVRLSAGEIPCDPPRISSVPSVPMLRITIEDDGPGIPEEHRARLFEPFFTTKRNGTGLGLPIAFELVRQNGGFLFVESEAGTGTSFHIYLPRGETSTRRETPAPATPREPSAPLTRVLLVEDDEPVAEGLMTLLETIGVETRWVTEGSAAESAVESFRPDLLLLDVGLPDIPGTEVFEGIRKRWTRLPVVFSTGHGEPLVASVDRHTLTLRKPYGVQDLLEAWTSIAGH